MVGERFAGSFLCLVIGALTYRRARLTMLTGPCTKGGGSLGTTFSPERYDRSLARFRYQTVRRGTIRDERSGLATVSILDITDIRDINFDVLR